MIFKFEKSLYFWLAVVVTGFLAMGTALFFQYILGDEPCVLCIEVRLLVSSITILAAIMLLAYRFNYLRILAHMGLVTLSWFLLTTSRDLYLIEIGEKQGECRFNVGLPSWFDWESWLPALFEVRSACGESPQMLAGLSMAQMTYFFSIVALGLACLFLLVSLKNLYQEKLSSH